MRSMIVGAGIGGLTAAIALRRAGIDATVFERAEEIKEVGAGILLAANAVAALGEIGLSDDVGRLGTPASAGRVFTCRGKTLTEVPVEQLERMVGVSSAAVHRADLQELLLRKLGRQNVRLGAECSGFEQDDKGVDVVFADGSRERGDLLIGADGLHSTVRAGLFGPEKPRYAGYTAWRAVVRPGRGLLSWGMAFESWGRGARFGCAHIGDGRVYWFATRNAPEGERDGPPGSPSGPKALLTELFGGWHHPIPALVAETEEEAIRRDDLYDREPLAGSWGMGRVTLLGDAAHPSTPNLGQGACQAIEDARALSRCLEEVEDTSAPGGVASALRRYEDLRRERTAWIVRRSRAIGRVGQIENPLLCRLRNSALKATPDQLQLRQFESVVRPER
ncbi:MAG TPA: FAD-dependent monooxygenase [Rubrobacter sp.]|nr:FAD-dependent monooxygenase [Rubrobacter sp.]